MSEQPADDHRFDLSTGGKVAPFPREKFLRFLSKLKVQSKDYGLVPFRLLGSQRYILDELCKARDEGISNFLILKARQMGATTFFIALDMFWAFQNKGLLGTFVLHKEEARDDWRATIEVFYQEIPKKTVIDGQTVNFKPSLLHHNRNILSFANGSRFRYLIAGTSENRKGGLGRSGASNYTHMTEAAFYGNEDDLAAFTSSTSSIYPHRLFIKETTANGFNHFAEEWEEGLKSNTKRCIFVGWWRDERNQFASTHDFYPFFMPDSSISKLERDRVRAVKAEYGFTVTLQQIAWYRWKLEEEFHGDQSMMDQEFPWTADDAFQATGAKYFSTADLTNAIREARRHPFQPYKYHLTNRWEDIRVVGMPDPKRAELKIWEQASKFGYYVVSCDPAFGSSEAADRNVIQVWRCFADGNEQVAEFASNSLSMYQTSWVLAHLGGFYGVNESRVILEMNGPGKAVFSELQQVARDLRLMRPSSDNYELRNCLNRMHHFCYQRVDNIGGGDMVYQWMSTETLKAMICARFKDGFELGRLRIRSVPMLEEMRKVINSDGHIAAEGRGNDDRFIAGALAYECYNKWMRQKLINNNMTRAHAEVVEANGGESQMFKIVTNFLKRANIKVDAK